jgi:dihydroneopterin aldolase
MLASIRSPAEAEAAVAGGADLIEVSEPADRATVDQIVAAVAGRRPVGAMAGVVVREPELVLESIVSLASSGLAFVAIGLRGDRQNEAMLHTLASTASDLTAIAVLFAEDDPDPAFLSTLAPAGFAGAMLDTADEDGGRLLDHLDLPRLRAFVATSRSHGLLSGLAGGLEPPDIPRLLVLRPDILGFRAALRGSSGHSGLVRTETVRPIRELVSSDSADRPSLLASPDEDALDHVFVRDFVLPMRIGAYARERTPLQRVRFEVDVTVTRSTRRTRGMGDIFSYDIITDGIRMLVDAGHIALLETLAERIASMLLAQRRVVRVSVRLEKLDTGSGVVGIAIDRRRRE